MENISIERLEEIWIQIYRSRGDARLTGSFFLAPGREAEVGPSAIEFSSGDVRIGSETVLAGRRGRIECHIERYDIARFPGSAVWAVTSGSVSLSGHTPAVRFLNYFFRDSPVPRLSGGAGDLSLRGRIERGAAAGTARLSGRRISARTGPGEVRADADLTMGVRRWDLASGRVDLSQTRIRLADLESPGDRTSGWWGDFDVPSGTISGGIDVRVEAHCRDARPLFTLFGTTVPKLVRRPLELEDLTVTARVALASSFVRVRDLDARGGSTQVLGEYRRRGTRADGVFLIDAKPVPVAVALRDGKARVRPVGARRWFEREREEMFGDAETASQRARSTTTAVP